MKKKLIIFDMDGVLFDTIGFSQTAFLKKYPSFTEEMYKEVYCGNFPDEVKKYQHLRIEGTAEEEATYRLDYAKNKSLSQMFSGAKDLLKDLHTAGNILVLNTNAYERNCLPLLEKSGIKNLFDFIATLELSKSKVEKFKLIEEKYNLDKKDTLFITDSLGDLREADEAGVPTIAVTWGVHDASYFKREPHNNLLAIVSSIEELRKII